MGIRCKTIAAALTVSLAASAQFIVEKQDGTKAKMSSTAISFSQRINTWMLGGIDINDIKSIKAEPFNDRLGEYEAPQYSDYYRDISGWTQRDKWNLANVHDPSVMRTSRLAVSAYSIVPSRHSASVTDEIH